MEDVKSRLSDTSRDFVYLKRLLPPDQVEKVVNLHLPGVSLQREYRRYYPAGEEVAQTLGFTGQDDIGQEGMELALQEQLAGKPGSQRVIKDNRGYIVEDAGSLHPPKPGSDIVLSLDSNLQHIAYRELESAVRTHQAKSGAVVVLDARTGEVLALANYPSYNPNNRSNTSSQAMRNRAITDEFEPGSTMKPFTIATALENGKVTPNTVFNTEHGVYAVGNRKIHDAEPESMLTVAQIIQKSSNIGAAKIALSMKPEMMWQGLSDSGFGAQTGSNFPGEALGKLRDPKTWRPIEQATMAYGHGVSVNLLQLARAYTIFAEQRRTEAGFAAQAGCAADRQEGVFGTDRARGARHAGDGGEAGRHRAAGASGGLPRGGQDRHRAQAGEWPLRQPLYCLLRRLCAGIESAPGGRGDDQ